MGSRIRIAAVLLLAGLLAVQASATTVRPVLKPVDEYGRVSQRHPDIVEAYGNCACGPTAAINSFVYLMKHYGLTGLIEDMNGDDKVDEADYVEAVIKMGYYMGLVTDPLDPGFCSGISDAKMVAGKAKWIQEYNNSPDTLDIIMKGQDDEGVGGLTRCQPTAQFLYKELKACEDIELGFMWVDADGNTQGGHWITIYGLQFTDLDDDDVFDPDETGTVKLIDPWGSGTGFGDLATLHDGTLFTDAAGWLWIDYGMAYKGKIDIIVSESPVPEPVTMAGLTVALLGLARYVRTRVRFRAPRRGGL